MIPTAERVVNGAMSSKANILFSIPSFLEQWYEDEEAVKKLRSIDLVVSDFILAIKLPDTTSSGSPEDLSRSMLGITWYLKESMQEHASVCKFVTPQSMWNFAVN